MSLKFKVSMLILRVGLGVSFTMHGIDKFQGGVENIASWFQSMGIPGALGYAVALLEVMGGVALIIGLAIRVVSLLLFVVMVVAIVKVKWVTGFLGDGTGLGFELELAYLIVSGILFWFKNPLLSVDFTLFPDKRLIAS